MFLWCYYKTFLSCYEAIPLQYYITSYDHNRFLYHVYRYITTTSLFKHIAIPWPNPTLLKPFLFFSNHRPTFLFSSNHRPHPHRTPACVDPAHVRTHTVLQRHCTLGLCGAAPFTRHHATASTHPSIYLHTPPGRQAFYSSQCRPHDVQDVTLL